MRVPAAVRTILLLALAIVAVITFRSLVQVTVVNGHSMDGTYQTGDLLVSMKAPTYKVGDVITYHPGVITECTMCNVVHRIVRGNANHGWITKGDNNTNIDGWLVKSNEISGHVVLRVHPPTILRITYLPSFWIFLVLACIACWLFMRAFEVLEEDATRGPRHRLEDASADSSSTTSKGLHASLSRIRRTAGYFPAHVRRRVGAGAHRHQG